MNVHWRGVKWVIKSSAELLFDSAGGGNYICSEMYALSLLNMPIPIDYMHYQVLAWSNLSSLYCFQKHQQTMGRTVCQV